MNLSDFLLPNAVRVLGQSAGKKRLFQDLSEIAHQAFGILATDAFDALMERESLGPTGVGHGIALPHARLHGLDRIAAVFVRLERPMDYDSVDRQPVDLVLALFTPKNSGVEHLKALAQVSRTMRDAAICAKLRANSDPAALHAVLTETRTIQAA
jgi:PTS system nitrogen regulatory IIA component